MGAETFEQNAADYEPVPKKRKKRARCVSIILCTITAILVIAFCIVNRNVAEYYPGPAQKNTTNVYYIKEEKLTFSGLFTTALSLFGVVLGTLVDRLTLIAEEHHHLHQRYGGSRKKMIKACFSGILWGPVIALLGSTAIILVILIFVTGMPWFELSYLVYIFSGIGVGPLIMHLLNLNTQSEVRISTILEEKGMFVANGLAWSYYFNYLKQALPKFKETTSRSFPYPHEHIKLSSKELLLLIPHDCRMTDDLKTFDNKIDKLFDTGNDQEPFRFSVYRLTVSEHEQKYFAIQYVKEPLKTLREMSKLEDIKAVKRQTCEEEVKLLYKTLSGILKDPPDQDFNGCVLVPIKAKNQENLKNGGLVTCILKIVQPPCSELVDGDPGFVKPRDKTLLCVNEGNSSKSNSRSAQTVKKRGAGQTGLTNEVTIHDEQQEKGKRIDSETRNKQDDESNDKNGKKRGKKLKREYENKKSDDTEKMIPAEYHDPPHTDQRKPSKVQQLVQEVGDGNDSGASTSRNSTEMVDTANGSQQSEQQDDHSSNNTQDQSKEL